MAAGDWELYFSVDDLAYQQVRSIESHKKKIRSKIYIQNLKKYPEIIEKLKLPPVGSAAPDFNNRS